MRPKSYKNYGGNVKVKLDPSYYGKKADLKGATGVDTTNLAAKLDLVSLKTEVDETDIDKVKTVPAD